MMDAGDGIFAEQLRAVRLERGMSQIDLAADMDVSPRHISDYERGKTDPRLSTVRRIAETLGVPVARLVEGSGE